MIKTFPTALYQEILRTTDSLEYDGRVSKIVGLTVESSGPPGKIGDICNIYTLNQDRYIRAEVVGFNDNRVLLMPFGNLEGVGLGSRVVSADSLFTVPVGTQLVGRVLDGLGRPMDSKPLLHLEDLYPAENTAPNPLTRQRIRRVLPLGVKSLDGLLTLGCGQRIGIFAGSGVGKSSLLGMIARNTTADINVISLVGERGREVRDFIEKDLQEEGLKKSVVVVATSDTPALIRLKSAMVSTAIAEYFRDLGYDVLLLMDSLTRFAMAQREIGMAAGEPPVSRGFPPSVYALLPKLLERSGTAEKGSITGIYTVLVEGDDMNEPISDTVRSILDGHIVLSRSLAHNNHYPPVDVLGSISRVMSDIVAPQHAQAAGFLRNKLAIYQEASDLINIGAYHKGANPEIDEAVRLQPSIQAFLKQEMNESYSYEEIVAMLEDLTKL
ncbi:MAG: flagellar protein export ATPase FliI [Firmicutes bacterium]|nr:flagellar protein export ATPase FliI [Bacillota bacterium]